MTDKISARAAVTSTQRGGYGKNIVTGNDIEDQKRYAARLHLLFEPTENVKFLLSGEYGKQDDSSGLFGYLAPLFPSNPNFVPRGAGGYSDPNSRDLASSYDPRLKRDTWSITGTLDWQLTDDLSLRNVINYRKLNFLLAQDLDVSSVNNATFVTIPLHDKQFSEEFQLAYETDKISAITGLFYFHESFRGQTDLGTGPTTGIFFTLTGKSTTDAFAPFFNVAYNLTDAIKLRVGGRYSSEKRTIINDSFLNGARITTDNDIADDERKISKYTGEYGVDWKISRNTLLYATYSQGFRSGAALIMQSGAGIINPTTVNNYEVGLKYSNRNLFANLALFTAKTKNLQRTQATVTALGVLNTKVNNVNSLETKGVELEAGWSPTTNLRLGGSVAWLEAEFQDFVSDDPIIQGTNLIQVAGNTTNQAPRWKWTTNAEYTVPFNNGSSLVASADLAYQSKVYFDEFNRAPFSENAYALLDANVTYNFVGDQLSLSVWGKNLTGQDRFADVSFSANGQVISKQWVAPRTVGATLRYKF
ncbi:MAG: TonB-dependent receptor [Sphingobium sp.]|uniref:TonB-dependent receptor n=1 Tax=Sphingobium sp. TaxID=1912891 RepID=UPI0029AB3955|nr:TonB-dependent receptor [Sphingobium sp.]MDX3909548.1 TonB-dependent receptor [Sphingobium sp.]